MEVVALIRDIVIILIGLFSIAVLAILALIAWKTYQLFKYFRNEVPDLVTSAKEAATSARQTAQSVQGTAMFLEEVAVSPAIRMVALVAAIGRFFSVLFGRRGAEPQADEAQSGDLSRVER